ncbi:MAG: cupin domain-containing protein [Candidatus Eremiobacteraeota bacterium]|nr:cupin domain-containing protein [Candidatus Eremiobacteraeota bacterium]MBV8355570.1 cupin domain-containing protein [Candidatus Eremiobacteraeota bacterium]
MDKHNIKGNRAFFSVLQTAERTQTAMMTLAPGQASGPKDNDHPQSEQVLLLLSGRLSAEIGDERAMLVEGDVVVVPTRIPHRFVNESNEPAVTFNVYGPPAY